MTNRIATTLLFSFSIIWSIPAWSQGAADIYNHPDSSLSWWERVNNRHDWLRQGLGTRYTFGKSVGVIVAISEYSGEFYDLASPVEDAERMKNFLLTEADFDLVYVLTDSDATRSNIRTLMEQTIPAVVGINDRLLVYWAGHGGSARNFAGQPYGFLALQNATKDGRVDSIHMDETNRWLRRIKARHVLYVFDACYSGLALQTASISSDPVWEQMTGPSDYLLTSSSSTQESYGYTDGSGGLFTTAFLEGAKGAADFNSDGLSTVTEIAAYLEPRLAEATGLGFVQSPQFGSIGRQEGRFFFLNSSGTVLDVHTSSSECMAYQLAARRRQKLCTVPNTPVEQFSSRRERSEVADTGVEALASQLRETAKLTYWKCGLGGCEFLVRNPDTGLCSSLVEKVELSQSGEQSWAELDRSRCEDAVYSRQTRLCANFQTFPFNIRHGVPFTVRTTFRTGTNIVSAIKQESDIQRYEYGSDIRFEDVWTVMKPIEERNPHGPAPTAAISFKPANVVVGGFTIETGLDNCLPGLPSTNHIGTISHNGWLMDQDGDGLVRVSTANRRGLSFGPSHQSRLFQDAPEQYTAMMDGESVVGIAVEHTDGTRIGPYWYMFDARIPVKKAASRERLPTLSCDQLRFHQKKHVCKPDKNLAWLDAERVAFGSTPEALTYVFEIDYSVEKFLLSECAHDAEFCEPFMFSVPTQWSNVYYQITAANEEVRPIERINIE